MTLLVLAWTLLRSYRPGQTPTTATGLSTLRASTGDTSVTPTPYGSGTAATPEVLAATVL